MPTTPSNHEFWRQPSDAAPPPPLGEGSYEASQDYEERMRRYMERADVQADAEAARPADEAEARELKRAEEEARSHTKAPGQ